MIETRLFDAALEQYNEMRTACPWFDEQQHMCVTIEDTSSNIMEFIGIGTNFTNAKPALRAAFKRLRRDYDEQRFTVGYYVKGRLTSFVLK
jgi:hypothetical protein